ncbi:MAG: transcription elongation factor subunit Spt4 [Candidatus Caldarchaeum sp.]|nr:DNA-directed RNA polymerase subunit E'' [Candidatus Caldarchaeum sp.]MCS7133439.1 DNA-directed RNA polymerase subunit E'' [Candidatus Caldarchaeum sp.]MCX8201494.1 DNA-directed RNA polymerase subunit E'' [Candidatus Caldarchaeum sp.]MDW8062794.1 transcription elongation factor subunit Spt4 [Candidatus Caldarchaeum sp.]MDW8435032.1 transcription elongation factor subunit Spt4 [Candidatus Caldarchaeum sp.]
MSGKPRACRNCKRIVVGKSCDVCGSTNLSSSFSGLLLILDVEKSRIAKELGIRKSGRYAVKVD